MAKMIPLTQGKFTLVDDEDFEWLNQWKWFYDNGYAARNTGPRGHQKTLLMHRVIMNTPDGMDTDHINGVRSDNTRANLRVCDDAQNRANAGIRSDNSSGFIGVYKKKNRRKWYVQIQVGRRRKHVGSYETAEEAARAYDQVALKYFGEFAKLNFPD